MAFLDELGKLFTGTPAVQEQVSNLTPSQLRNQKMLEQAGRRRGAGGAFGTSADYYRDLLSNENPDLQAFMAPELRRFHQEIIPDLAEQFAGMGAGGGIGSSGFQNSLGQAGADLAERLGAIRAQLRQNAAQGLFNVGQAGLTPHTQWQTTQPGSEGLLSGLLPTALTAAGTAIGAPVLGAFGNAAGNWAKNLFSSGGGQMNQQGASSFGSSSPYGNQNGFNSTLPNFNWR